MTLGNGVFGMGMWIFAAHALSILSGLALVTVLAGVSFATFQIIKR